MKIDVITMWYNEAFIAPYFLKHYEFADTVYVLLDKDTTDESKEICSQFGNVKVEMVSFPDGLDDQRKIDMINSLYRSLDSDWVIAPDSDEFVFAFPLGTTIPEYLGRHRRADVIFVHMWEIYRHETDAALDPSVPVLEQRRHGDPVATGDVNQKQRWFRRGLAQRKPIVVRGGTNLRWLPVLHGFFTSKNQFRNRIDQALGTPRISNDVLFAAHWAMADPEIATRRRLSRRERLSQFNLERGYGIQNKDITRSEILNRCREHLNDPQLF